MFVKKMTAYAVIIALLFVGALFWQRMRASRESAAVSVATETSETGAAHGEGYRRPVLGRLGNFTAPEIAWALREKFSLDVMADLIEGQERVSLYNERTRVYNELAGSFEYLESDMLAALARVEADRDAIASAAVDDALAGAGDVWKVQRFLQLRGLYLSNPSGRMDDATAYAVKNYRSQRREPATGNVDENLLRALKADYLRGKRGIAIGF